MNEHATTKPARPMTQKQQDRAERRVERTTREISTVEEESTARERLTVEEAVAMYIATLASFLPVFDELTEESSTTSDSEVEQLLSERKKTSKKMGKKYKLMYRRRNVIGAEYFNGDEFDSSCSSQAEEKEEKRVEEAAPVAERETDTSGSDLPPFGSDEEDIESCSSVAAATNSPVFSSTLAHTTPELYRFSHPHPIVPVVADISPWINWLETPQETYDREMAIHAERVARRQQRAGLPSLREMRNMWDQRGNALVDGLVGL